MISLDTNILIRYLVRAAAHRNGASPVFTFDRRFSRIAGVRLVESSQ